jgi:apolipoprotein D and lipocalin family protein
MPVRNLLACAAFLAMSLAVPAVAQAPPLTTVPALDLDRYAGVWHEIARYENFFERMCKRDVTATYSRNADGTIRVTNACRKSDGSMASVDGVARMVAPPSKFEVRFAPDWLAWLPMVWANYWVIELADDYGYAVVSEPNREYLWILARDPRMSDAAYERIVGGLRARGFDPAKLIRNPTP